MGVVPIKHKEISRSNVFKQYTLLFYGFPSFDGALESIHERASEGVGSPKKEERSR